MFQVLKPFKKTREAEIFGNKCAQLFQLRTLLDRFPDEKVQVPDFFSIASDHLQRHLVQWNPEWEQLWKEFCQKQGTITTHLTAETKEILQQLRTHATRTFVDHCFHDEALDRWLIEHNDVPLIVRSSGIEDGETCVNAGGNASIAAVQAERKVISRALGEVVASYFSERSLEQRLLSGDSIVAEPFYAAFVQEMIIDQFEISEQTPTFTTVSGILFSSDPDHPNLTTIQSCFGHGEKIASAVDEGFDTFYVSSRGFIHPLIAVKEKSTAIVKKSQAATMYSMQTYELTSNNRCRSSLSRKTIQRLKALSDYLERQYGQSMDVEWVYDQKSEVLHIVQARALRQQQQFEAPNFLSEQILQRAEGVEIDSIVSAGDYVRLLQEDQVLVASTVEEALYQYLDVKTQKKIEAVLVSQWSPRTSHAATIFRQANIAVFSSDDCPLIISWLVKRDHHPVILDVQRKRCVRLSVPFDATCVYQGRFKSMPTPHYSVIAELLGDVEDGGFDNKSATVIAAMEAVLQHLNQQEKKIDSLALHALNCLFYQKNTSRFLNTYSLQSLELLTSKHTQSLDFEQMKALGSYALTNTLQDSWCAFIDRVALLEEQQQDRFKEMLQTLLDREFFPQWLHLSFPLLPIDDQSFSEIVAATVEQFNHDLPVLKKINANEQKIARWLSPQYMEAWEKPEKFEGLWQDFSEEIVPMTAEEELYQKLCAGDTSPYLKAEITYHLHHVVECFDETIKSLKGSPHYASSPMLMNQQVTRTATVMDEFLVFMEQMLERIPEKDFEHWAHSVFDDKEMLLKQNMLSFIREAFDHQKTKPNLQDLLQPSKGFSVQASSIGSGCAFYRALTSKWKATKEDALTMLTLEDLFTLMHQNLLRALSLLYNRENSSLMYFPIPDHFKTVCQALLDVESELYTPGSPGDMEYLGTSKPYRLFSEYHYPTLCITYIHPMRHHSAIFRAIFDQRDQSVTFRGNFFGHNYEKRMTNIQNYLTLSALLEGWTADPLPYYEEGRNTLTFGWKFSQEKIEQGPQVMNKLKAMLERAERGIFYRDLGEEVAQLLLRCQESVQGDRNVQQYLAEVERNCDCNN